VLLIGTVVLVGALTFLPALLLGLGIIAYVYRRSRRPSAAEV